MYLEFETNQTKDNDFPNNKRPGERYYTRTQECLLFKGSSKYPDKFDLNISFSSSREEQQSVSGFAPGRYELSEDSFGFDNRRNPVVDFTKIRPVPVKPALQKAS